MKETTLYTAAVLAVATILAAGLAILPSSVQETRANPCAEASQASAGNAEQNVFEEGEGDAEALTAEGNAENDAETLTGQGTNIVDCDLTGVVINEEVIAEESLGLTEEEAAEAAEDAEFE